MTTEKNWPCSIWRTVYCNDEKLLEEGFRSRVRLYHNVALPFTPFVGLSIEYFNETFDQGAQGKIFVKEFNSNPIKNINWNCSYQGFRCFEDEIALERRHFGIHLKQYLEDSWFPINPDESEDINKIINELKVEAK